MNIIKREENSFFLANTLVKEQSNTTQKRLLPMSSSTVEITFYQCSVSIASDVIANSADNSDAISIKLNMCQIGAGIPA